MTVKDVTTTGPPLQPLQTFNQNELNDIDLFELGEKFGTEEAAREWLERAIWNGNRICPRCKSSNTRPNDNANKMPYRCRSCNAFFSVKTGTCMHSSKLPLRKWAYAIYLVLVHPKGISNLQLAKLIRVSHKTAWFLTHRIRMAWSNQELKREGIVEIDETFIGGKEKNKHADKKLKAGRGAVGKQIVVGAVERGGRLVAKPIANRTKKTLHHFVLQTVHPKAAVMTDDWGGYEGLPLKHGIVNHSAKIYVAGIKHTNTIESVWAKVKRAYMGVFHHVTHKHLHRYIDEIAGKHNLRFQKVSDQMTEVAQAMSRHRLRYVDLTAR